MSADPLAVHGLGEADLNAYAYVSGRALIAVDPVGLESKPPPGAKVHVFEQGDPKGTGTVCYRCPAVQAPSGTPSSSGGTGNGGTERFAEGDPLAALSGQAPLLPTRRGAPGAAGTMSEGSGGDGARKGVPGGSKYGSEYGHCTGTCIESKWTKEVEATAKVVDAASTVAGVMGLLKAAVKWGFRKLAKHAGREFGEAAEQAVKFETRRMAAEAVNLTAEQSKNLRRFTSKFKKGIEPTVEHLGEGAVRFRAEVPGRVPGSRAIYEKVVDKTGATVRAIKTTIDPKGNIVHRKDKLR